MTAWSSRTILAWREAEMGKTRLSGSTYTQLFHISTWRLLTPLPTGRKSGPFEWITDGGHEQTSVIYHVNIYLRKQVSHLKTFSLELLTIKKNILDCIHTTECHMMMLYYKIYDFCRTSITISMFCGCHHLTWTVSSQILFPW